MKKKKDNKKKKTHITHVIIETSDGTTIIVNRNMKVEEFNWLDLDSKKVKK
jgi:hypothetical protein